MKELDIEITNEDAIILNKIESYFERSPDGFSVYEIDDTLYVASHFPFHSGAKNIQFCVRNHKIADEFFSPFKKTSTKLKPRKDKLNMMVSTRVPASNL